MLSTKSPLFEKRKTTFEEKFPQIKDFTAVITEKGNGVESWNEKTIVSRESHPPNYKIDCKNPVCSDGGLKLLPILVGMVDSRQEELETTERCQGNEGNKRNLRSCPNKWAVTIKIEYK
jgi:hypothetical protein